MHRLKYTDENEKKKKREIKTKSATESRANRGKKDPSAQKSQER